jgi:hypothetical protein
MLIGDRVCDLFILIATLCSPDHVTKIMEANRILQMSIFAISHYELRLSVIATIVLQAIRFTIVGERRQRNEHGMDAQDESGPRVTDDKSFAVMELLGVFRMQTGTMLPRAVNENGHCPGQTFQGVPRFGTLRGWLLGEALSRRERHGGMALYPLTAWGVVPSRKSCRFFAGMFLPHDHQKEQRAGADPLQTLTDCDTTCDPSLQGVSRHGASPLEPRRHV